MKVASSSIVDELETFGAPGTEPVWGEMFPHRIWAEEGLSGDMPLHALVVPRVALLRFSVQCHTAAFDIKQLMCDPTGRENWKMMGFRICWQR